MKITIRDHRLFEKRIRILFFLRSIENLYSCKKKKKRKRMLDNKENVDRGGINENIYIYIYIKECNAEKRAMNSALARIHPSI